MKMEADDPFSMEIQKDQKQKSKQPEIPFMELKIQPGFFCFFKQYVEKNNIYYDECYQRVLKSHIDIERLKYPIESILLDKSKTFQAKINAITEKSQPHQRYYLAGQQRNVTVFSKISFTQDAEKQIKQLEQQLAMYKLHRSTILQDKRNIFKKAKQENQQRIRQQQAQFERRKLVLDNLENELGNKL